MNKFALAIGFSVALSWPATSPLRAQPRGTVVVAAASDLQPVIPEIASAFERATGITATVTFGSSGNFFAQIQNGAPFDVFLSADAEYPRRLAAAGQATTVAEYAIGRLVLWTRSDSGLDTRQGLELLRDTRVRRVAIANPAVAPYGRAAVAALTSRGLLPAVEKKLVYAENVSQAAQLAESGNADVALIGHSLALGPALKLAGRFSDVPAGAHPPIVQAVAVVSAARNKENGRALVDFLRGPDARRILQSFGFDVPALPAGPERR